MRIALLLIAACAADVSAIEQQLAAPGSCATFAVPDDGVDDRAAIQSAIDTQGCADLSSGTYDVIVTSPRTGSRYDLLTLTGGRTLRGAGPATVIRFSGDAARSDLRGIGMTGDSNLVADLTLDTTGLTNTEEQTHAIQITGPALNQRVSGNWFRHPSLGASAGGDCIKVVGYDQTATTPDMRVSMVITGNVFAQCDRSGVAVHSGLRDALINSNLFLETGDQDIDLEGSGGAIDSLVISGNSFRRTLNNGVSVAIAAGLTRRAVFSGNIVNGGRLFTYNVERLSVTGNVFTVPWQAIEMVKMTKEVVIAGNAFAGTDDTATAGMMISATHHNSGMPGMVSITGNTFRAANPLGLFVAVTSAESVSIANNSFTWSPAAAPAGRVAALAYGLVRPTEAIAFTNNIVTGPYARTLMVTNSYEASSGGGIRAVTFAGNILRGPAAGLLCQNPGPGPYVSYGNSGAPHQCFAAITGGL